MAAPPENGTYVSLLLIVLAVLCATPARAQTFEIPIACRLGEICAVQNYVDLDPSPDARDPVCGPLTYDGHDGLDFRVPAALARGGVYAIAPAAGIVSAVRDGEQEGAYLAGGRTAISGRECGNGVVIAHEDGWSSQLCHLRMGSLAVQAGQSVARGQTIGLVGLSGLTEFPHLHLTLRRNGVKLDPLTGLPIGEIRCGGTAATPGDHWSEAARVQLAFQGTQWFALGFSGAPPDSKMRPEDLSPNAAPHAPVLVFWALSIGLQAGDILRVRLRDGAVLAEATRKQARNQAEAWLYVGKKTPRGGWYLGSYKGDAEVERNGRIVAARMEILRLHN